MRPSNHSSTDLPSARSGVAVSPKRIFRLQTRQQALVARSCCMMKLVHDDHIESVRLNIVDPVGKGLHRGKDVATRVWTFAANQPLTEPRLAQDELEDLLALTQDLVAVRDEEQGMTHTLVAQPLEIEGRNPGLAGPGRRDHEITVMPAQALRFEGLECNRLVRLRRDVDQQRQRGDVVGCTAAALSRERVVEPLGVTPGCIVLELWLLPILFEGCLESLDHLGVLGRAHTHVPFEALDLCRVGEVRRADIGGVKTALAVEQPRLGMKPGPGDLVGNLHSRAEVDKCVQCPTFGRPGINACDHAHLCTLPHPFFKLGAEQTQPRVTHKRAQEIDPIGAWDLPRNLARDLDIAPSIDEKPGPTERERRARDWRRCAAQNTAFDSFQEQARSVCDPVVGHRAMFDEHLHQPVRKGDLVG